MKESLLLFDIDGTLIMGGHSRHGEAMEQAVEYHTGKSISVEKVDPAGKTDTGIILEMLSRAGCGPEESGRLLPLVFDTMVEKYRIIEEDLTPYVFPGALKAVTSLSRQKQLILGLLTGNHSSVAWHKLKMAGIDGYFSIGSFGSESAERHALVPLAVKRAEDRCGCPITADNVVVIGDTPRDISCGKRNNVRTVAVATGACPISMLLPHGADLTLSDLGEYEKITAMLYEQADRRPV